MAKRKKGKHRKRTNANVPAKGRLRDMADILWSVAVRDDWYHRCAACGRLKPDAHHLIPRQHEETRYRTRNGIALCPHCHQFNPDRSPHQNAAGWLAWLAANQPELHKWYTEMTDTADYRTFVIGTRNATYYIDVIRGLRGYVSEEDYDRILGVKFSAWLDNED